MILNKVLVYIYLMLIITNEAEVVKRDIYITALVKAVILNRGCEKVLKLIYF